MKIAAFQAPLSQCHRADTIDLIREQLLRCEAASVDVLCCPEAILGGLADYAARPLDAALSARELHSTLRPLSTPTVTTIVGFTEIDRDSKLFNSAAVLSKGSVVGIHRKWHPAINRSIYSAGSNSPVFTVGSLTFGVLICFDSRFPELASDLVAKGAQALFVPTNNGMPASKGGPELIDLARRTDISIAKTHGVPVVRADVAGHAEELVSYGCSSIVDRHGTVIAAGPSLQPELLLASLDIPAATSRE